MGWSRPEPVMSVTGAGFEEKGRGRPAARFTTGRAMSVSMEPSGI